MRTEDEIRTTVRSRYAQLATSRVPCCDRRGLDGVGYTDDDLSGLPDEALMTLGVGNPVSHAGIEQGETVVDLGSGAGLDAILAARGAGPAGRVIGVDLTPEMVARARESAGRLGLANVEFRLGPIEDLPVEDASADVVLSNCVINLAPDKEAVFREAYRALRPGGRIVVSDVVAREALPPEVRRDPKRWASCVGGAISEDEYLGAFRRAGFERVEVLSRDDGAAGLVYRVTVRAEKPDRSG